MKLQGMSWKVISLCAIAVVGLAVILGLIPQLIIAVFPAGAVYILGVKKKRPPIRIVAAGLGVLGGVMGAIPSLSLLLFPRPGWPGFFLYAPAMWGTLASLMAIGGGILALERPRVGGILMLLGAVVGWSAMIDAYFHTSFFLLPAMVLALAPEKKRPAAIYVAMSLGIIGGLFAVVSAFAGAAEILWMYRGREEFPFVFWTWVLLFPGMGLPAGVLVLAKPQVAGILMVISAISGVAGFIGLGMLEEHYDLVVLALAGFPLVIAGTIACNKKALRVSGVVATIFLLIFFSYIIHLYLYRGM